MSEKELSKEELERQNGEELPDREAMSVITPAVGGEIDPVLPLPNEDAEPVDEKSDEPPPHHRREP